ncbi:MAG: hypothetical protein H9535_05955 [Ignavibacteria bacterium]|nr:hypothetical protein [Ignavibacteria bacterium]
MQPLISEPSFTLFSACTPMHKRCSWKLWVLLLSLPILFFRPVLSSAATISWNVAAGGAYTWSNGANWAGGVAPGPGDVANFPDLGVYTTITLSGLPASVQGIINISGRNVEIAAGSTLVVTAAGSNVNGTSFIDVLGTIEFTNGASTTGASGYRIQSGGRMRINGNPTITGAAVQYFAGSTLEYSGSGNRITGQELPATMNGAVIVNKSLAAETITLSAGTNIAGLTVTQGVFDAAGFTSTFSAASSVSVNGTLTVAASGLVTVASGQTLTMNGTMNLNGGGDQLDIPSSTLVLATNSTVTGAGLIKANSNGTVRIQAATLTPGNFTSAWIYCLIVDRPTDVTYTGSLTVGNGGLQLVNTGNLFVNCGGLSIVDGIGVSQTSTGRISLVGCGSGLDMQDDNLDGNHYVPGMNNLYINRAGGVNLTNTMDIVNLNYTSGALNVNNTGNLIASIPAALTVPAGRILNINNGGKVTILPTRGLINSGTININNGGILEFQGDNNPNSRISGAGVYNYSGTLANLNYTLGSASGVWEAGPEFPSPMPGTVNVIKPGNATLFITSTKTMTGPMIVQSGCLAVITAGGNLTLGAGSQVQNGATLQAVNNSTVGGGANLTVQTGGKLQFVNTPKATWTGMPTYQVNSVLEYFGGPFTTGVELPATMNGNISLNSPGSDATLGASTVLNGNLLLAASPNNGTFTIASPNILTLAGGGNSIGNGSTLVANAGAAECVITSGGDLTNNGTMNINGTLTLDGTGSYNAASANSPTITGVLRYTGTNPSFTTGKEFPAIGVSSVVVNRAVAGNMVILNTGKTVGMNATITQGILQTAPIGVSLTHAITGNLVVAANGRLRMQENSVVTVGVGTTYSAATSTLEYAGTIGKAATGGELPAAMAGTVLVNNSGGVTLNAGKTINTLNFTSGRLISSGFGTVVGANLIGGGGTSYYDCAGGGTLSLVLPAGLTAGPFTMPLGNGAGFYRPITLSTTTMSGLGSVTTSVFAGAPGGGATDGGGFVGIATVPEYWSVQGANLTSTQMRPSRTPTVLPGTSRLGYSSTVNGTYNNQTATVNSPGSGDMQSTLALAAGFVVIGTGPSANSDIIETPGYTYTSSIAHSNPANREPASPTTGSDVLWSMRLRDGGGAADADALTTELNSLTLNITTDSPSSPLYQVALFTPGGVQIGVTQNVSGTTATTVTFAGLFGANVTAPDNGFIDVVLRGTFKQTGVIDTANVRFQVVSAAANIAGSTFATANAGGAISIDNSVTTGLPANLLKNRIDIVATQLAFPDAIGNQIVNTNFTPSITVLAVDPFFNVDRTITGTITLSSGLFTISAGGSAAVPLGTGTSSFAGLQVSNTGLTGSLIATMGALTGNSATFDVTTIPTYWDCTIPRIPASVPMLPIGGRSMNFSNVTLSIPPTPPVLGQNSITNVAPGTTILITGDWVMNWPGGVYCPGCVVQMYVGIGSGFGAAGNGSSAGGFTQCLGSGVYNGSTGTMNFTFNAPAKPGVYYIKQNWTLHYYCNPHPVTFGSDTANAIAVIQVVEPTPLGACNEPDIIETPGFVYPANINYAVFTSSTMSVGNPAVWGFRVRDYGTIPTQGDVDNKPTQITSLGINVTDPGGVLQSIALYQGAGQISTPVTVTGSGLITFPTLGTVVIAPDNGVIDILVRANFRTSALTPPMDNRQFSFSISAANVVTAPNAVSTQKSMITPFVTATSTNNLNDNRVTVTATKTVYTAQPPASTPVGTLITAPITIRAVDINNNIDVDYVTPISISHPRLIGSPIIIPSTSGIATFSGLAFNAAFTNGVLSESSGGLTTTNSMSFNVVPATFHFKFASASANVLTNWQLAGFPTINPVAIGLSDATYIVGSPAFDPAAANITAPLTINPNSILQISGTAGGSTLNVNAGQTLTNNGTLSIQGGGRLLLTDDGTIAAVSANPVTYTTTNATLEYAGGGAMNRTTNPIEFPSPLNARLIVSRSMGAFSLNLDASKTVLGEFQKNAAGTMVVGTGQVLDLQGGTYYSGGPLNLTGTGSLNVPASGTFLITGGSLNLTGTGAATIAGGFSSQGGAVNIGATTLTLSGAINFGAGTVTPSAGFGTLDINGAGAISGTLGGGVQFAQFTMNRANQVLSLSAGSNLRAVNLSLLNGIIRTSAAADYVDVAGTFTPVGSATTYIEGKLRRALLPATLNNAGSFEFTVGKSGVFLPITFLNVTGNNVVLQAEAFAVGSGGASGVGFSSVSATEYWQSSLQGGAFSSGLVQLSRPAPPLVAAAVVGHSATQTGSYTGIGGSVSSPNVLSASPVLSADRFFALGVLSNVFYYNSGPAENVTSWNSDILGIGAPATDFITGGTTFIVPSGKNAPFTSNQTFAPGVTILVNGGGTLSVRNGSTLNVGIFRVGADATLSLADSAKINAPSGVNYLSPTAQLLYQTPSANRVATSNEFPATMPGSVMVSNGTVRLDTTTSVRNITIQGALTLKNSALDFGKDSTRLRIEGAISFNPSQFNTNRTHSLTIAGSGSISGTINFSNNVIGSLSMQRPGVTLLLGDSLEIGSQLSLFSGNIMPPASRVLSLTNSADTALMGGSFSSFVSGIFARVLPASLTPADAKTHFYPIGKGATYLPLTLLNATTGSVSPLVAAEAFSIGAGGSVALGVNGALSNTEHWRVQSLSSGFAGAQVGVMRTSTSFTASDKLVVSSTKTGVYQSAGGVLTPIAQGTSLVGDAVENSTERFYSAVSPTLGSPRITGFSPSRGGEQTTMLVTGTNLTGVSAVAIGGIPVASFQVLSSTTISITVGAVASGPVQIGSPIGGAASDSSFTFVPSPRIFNASPSPAGLGVPIVITGDNFTGASYMNIGGVDIPSNLFTVTMGGTVITTTVPVNATNPTIMISAPGGTAISTNALVLLPPPTITSINPQVASTSEIITLFGTNFVNVQSVRFGTTSAQYTVNSPTRITVIVPPRLNTAPSQVFITVQTGSGTATTATRFAYNPQPGGIPNGVDPLRLVVISEARDKITTLGGRVRVTGANMELIQQIKLITVAGSTNASWLLSSSAALTLIVPTTGLLKSSTGTLSSAPVTMDVLGAFNRVVSSNAFTVFGIPSILSITPTEANGGEEVIVGGTAMNLITNITIGGTAATFRVLDSTRISVTVPFRLTADSVRLPASGVLGFTSFGGITGTGGTIINSALAGGQPVITSFSPTSGPPGTEVVLLGANLGSVRDVAVVGIPVASFVVNSPTRMTLVLSTAASLRSQGPITLQTSFGTSVDSRTLYSFPYSLEADQNAANAIVTSLGGDPSRLTIQTDNNRITVLRLSGAGLRGPIPAVIATLTELRELDLSNNFLSGSVPVSLTALKKLERLNLSNNLLSGALTPGVFCSYGNMRFLDVSRNNLTGEIPVCIADLDKIEILNLTFNRFTSLIPWQLGKMTSLRELRLGNNQLTGELPAELGTGGVRVTAKKTAVTTRVPTVQVIDVSNNQFSGGIPDEWGNIPQLTELSAVNCGLTGKLPATIRDWQRISIIRLANNKFSGVIPEFYAGSLREFVVDNNRFTGALPASFSQAPVLRTLSAANNRLTLIPNLAVSGRLDTVRLDSNRLEFGSLEPIRATFFQANGQDSVPAGDSIIASLGDVVQLASNIGGASTSYQWLKNGVAVRGAAGATLTLQGIVPQDVGTYICRATNSRVQGVTLFTQSQRIVLTSATQTIAAPSLIFPSANATNIAPRPSFRWSRASGADSYTILVARDRALRTDAQSITLAQPELGDSIVLPWASAAGRGVLLERGVQYYWSVRAAASSEEFLPSWSDTLSFRVVPFGQDLAFSSVDVGKATIGDSARATGSIVNIGDDALLVQSAQVESGLENVFALNFTQKLLPKDASASFDVLFKPNRADTIRANVTVRYADAAGQGARSVSIDKALVGRGGALQVDPLDFDSVRVGKVSVQSARIINRSDKEVIINSARILAQRGSMESAFELVAPVANLKISARDTIFIPIRCLTLTRGFKSSILEIVTDNDKTQADITAIARLIRPDDPAVSFSVQPSPSEAAPGSAVRLDVVINDFSQQLATALIGAAQPEVRLTLRFDKQVLALDDASGIARMQRGSSTNASVTVSARWDGRSRTVASLQCRAVAGERTTTSLEIINAEWGSTSATAKPDWERRVFVEEPDIARASTFTTRVSTAGGRRLISGTTSSATPPLLSLARPNPASDVISLSYTLFDDALVTLDVLNMKGDVVQILLAETSRSVGEYSLSASVRTLPTGTYMLRLRANGASSVTQRMDIGR